MYIPGFRWFNLADTKRSSIFPVESIKTVRLNQYDTVQGEGKDQIKRVLKHPVPIAAIGSVALIVLTCSSKIFFDAAEQMTHSYKRFRDA